MLPAICRKLACRNIDVNAVIQVCGCEAIGPAIAPVPLHATRLT